MPINIPKQLPAWDILESENIFLMDNRRAITQDIRPLNIIILNLMPEKEKTETQLLRLLGNSPLQVNITFMHTATYKSKNVSQSHLDQFYTTFSKIKNRRYDGMIITGAPIALLPFEKVNYWRELTEIMDWSITHVTSVLHICWGALAALYYHFGIDKFELPKKCFGIYKHHLEDRTVELVRGFDAEFLAPHSHLTDAYVEEILGCKDIHLLASSEDGGAFLMISKDQKHMMVTGHLEYDAYTLADEYRRDRNKGLDIDLPANYFPDDDPGSTPVNRWRSHAHLLFSNWLNYYVYQQTPYVWE